MRRSFKRRGMPGRRSRGSRRGFKRRGRASVRPWRRGIRLQGVCVLCRDPYIPLYGTRAASPCGKCDACYYNRNSLWQSRILMESLCHEKNVFATFTYDDEHLPEGGSLVPKHLQDYLKRLRSAYAKPIRYYLAGEYGDTNFRPHYHAALFGIGPEDSDILSSTWGMGSVHVGELTPASARYISSYVNKKMMKVDDVRLGGKYPEFSRKSLKPGIGALSVSSVVDALSSDAGNRALLLSGDVPFSLKIGGKTMPLGRYMRSVIRKSLDRYTVHPYTGEVKYGPSERSKIEYSQEMQALFDAWLVDPKLSSKTFKQYLSAIDNGRYNSVKSRIKNGKEKLL